MCHAVLDTSLVLVQYTPNPYFRPILLDHIVYRIPILNETKIYKTLTWVVFNT